MTVSVKTPAIKVTRDPNHRAYESKNPPESRSRELGIDGDDNSEGVPKFIAAPCEKVITGKNNTSIVLGRDRPASRASGYMATGDTHAGSIDIVVGRMGHKATAYRTLKAGEMGPPGPLETDPDFIADAARIYISQKTDIDKNFHLPIGKVGTSKSKSGIGIKADAIRIIAREGIKLVTRTDAKNAQGSDVLDVNGVDIIAGGKGAPEPQPMVLGNNLEKALQRLAKHVVDLNGVVSTMLLIQSDFNYALQTHWHYSPFFGTPTSPSDDLLFGSGVTVAKDMLTKAMRSLYKNKQNLGLWKAAYVQKTGSKYINSQWNNVN
jgi:hypothetical protein